MLMKYMYVLRHKLLQWLFTLCAMSVIVCLCEEQSTQNCVLVPPRYTMYPWYHNYVRHSKYLHV